MNGWRYINSFISFTAYYRQILVKLVNVLLVIKWNNIIPNGLEHVLASSLTMLIIVSPVLLHATITLMFYFLSTLEAAKLILVT